MIEQFSLDGNSAGYYIGRMSNLLRFAVILVVLAGCAGPTQSLNHQQQAGLEEAKAFLLAAAKAYGLPKPWIMVGIDPSRPAGASYRSGTFYVSERVLTNRHLVALMAHEAAHYVLGHEPGTLGAVGSRTIILDAQMRREHEANIKAVEILAKVKGWDEERAFRTVLAWLDGWRRVVERGGLGIPDGHAHPCKELLDFIDHWATKYPVVPRPVCRTA